MAKRVTFTIAVGFIVSMSIGCAPIMVSVSDPAIQTASNPCYEAQFEPLKQGGRSFVVFRLTVTNRTETELQIDWNTTRYLFDGRPYGAYVFRGIEPETIKNRTIAPDIILPRDTFTRIIAPQALLAYVPFREQHTLSPDESAISGGPIPAGENGVLLIVRKNGEEIAEKLVVRITDVEDEGQWRMPASSSY